MDLEQAGVPIAIVLVILFFVAVALALLFWPTIRILKRLGLSPWMSLLLIVPVGNLLLLWIVAYSDWRDVKALSRTA